MIPSKAFSKTIEEEGESIRKSERQGIALAVGVSIMVIGIVLVYTATNGQWTLENAAARVVQTISGVFMIIVGAYLFAWGVSDRAGEAAGNFLGYIWDRFLKAFGK